MHRVPEKFVSGVVGKVGEITVANQQTDDARWSDDERWQLIRQGGIEVFRREGFSRARLEDVAIEVGIDRALLCRYVRSKEELFVALVEQPAYEMTRRCREALASDLSADQKLRLALRAFIEGLATHPELFLLFNESRYLATTFEARDIVENADSYGKTLCAIVTEGVRSGVFRSDLDPRLVMLGILGMHNWIHRWYVPGGRNSLTEIGDTFAEMVLAGLRPIGR
ncbi:TetR/AcrR family transcriptional regulator [Mycobacterium asiaticum]|uniref:TetR/AcrR family transcriptional regulator n=1 Tax=Mycobacterium asiaticum TaxID=1790 RepID=UPI0020A59C6B|nr:TetR/AcrR family transcriptional regulator [Mycobacterium asiaticum]